MAYKQHFIEWFSGKQLPSYWLLENITGSGGTNGMVDAVDGGYAFTSGAGGTDLSFLGFDDICQYSNTGSVVIWVGKVGSIAGQGGWGLAGLSTNISINSIKILNGGGTYMKFYTANNTVEANTDTTSTAVGSDSFRVYKMEQLASSAIETINGSVGATRTTNLSTAKMQPFAYNRLSSRTTTQRYVECYNT